MTLTAPFTETTIQVSDTPIADDPDRRCKQIIHDTTGEQAKWVIYDPAHVAAVVHLWHPTNSTRFMLGAAGYRHSQSLRTGELWIKPTTASKGGR